MRLRPRFELESWQKDALAAWRRTGPQHQGILAIHHGAGKTVIAAAAMCAVVEDASADRFVIVVPSKALVDHWRRALPAFTTLLPKEIGTESHQDTLQHKKVLIAVYDTAARRRRNESFLAHLCRGHRVTLIVDDCHRAASREQRTFFDATTVHRLGLSATPHRPDLLDQDGRVLPLERRPHGRALGPVCYRLSLRDADQRDLLPRHRIHHHGLTLSATERLAYERHTQRVTSARLELEAATGGSSDLSKYLRSPDLSVQAYAQDLQNALRTRKHFLNHASERLRVAKLLIQSVWSSSSPPRAMLLFDEQVGERATGQHPPDLEEQRRFHARHMADQLRALCDAGRLPFDAHAVALDLVDAERKAALRGLTDGSVRVLISIDALHEGIDAPDVEMGVCVAGTSNVQQRLRTMGRLLRAPRGPDGKRLDRSTSPVKELHLLYVRDTADEEVYRKRDWNAETGRDKNHWYTWEHGAVEALEGPPLRPLPAGPDDGSPESDTWLLVWQDACLAAVANDLPRVREIARQRTSLRHPWVFAALGILAGDHRIEAQELPSNATVDAMLPFMAQAFVDGDTERLEAGLQAFAETARPYGWSATRGFEILLGRHDARLDP